MRHEKIKLLGSVGTAVHKSRSGQVSAEYVLLLVAVTMSLVLLAYGLRVANCDGRTRFECGDVIQQLAGTISQRFLTITTIIKLPI